MKKTILAAVITLATAPAMASINLYDSVDEAGVQTGVKVDLSGAAEVQVINEFKDESQIRMDDGDLQFDVTMPISENLDVISTIAFNFEQNDDNSQYACNDELSVGFKNKLATFTIGRQVLISDDIGIDEAYELDNSISPDITDGKQVAKFKFDNKTFQFGVSYLNAEDNKAADIFDAMVGIKAGNFEGQIYIIDSENDSYNGGEVQAKYTIDSVTLAASYSDIEKYNKDFNGYSLVGTYSINDNTFALGYNFTDSEVIKEGKVEGESNRVYGNVTHKFNDNVKAYAEVACQDNENDKKAEDFGYVMGMEVSF